MASTIKVDTITTPDGTGNISVDRPLSGSGAGLTSLPAANLTGALPAISGASLTGMAGGAWNVISSTNITSSTASMEFTSGIDATYRTYALQWEGVTSTSSIVQGVVTVGDSGGFQQASGYYAVSARYNYTSTAGSPQGGDSDVIDLHGSYYSTSVSGSNQSGEIIFTRPIDGASFPILRWYVAGFNHSSQAFNSVGTAIRKSAITLDRIKWIYSSGNIATGRFTLYGIAHA